jgi:nicotinate-nucleotide--dimethylbenzimidazole phosphoribosyltransferase
VGAGAPPVGDAAGHPRRPPIPIAPVDERAAAAVRARLAAAPAGLAGLAAWLAAVSGRERPAARARLVVVAADHGVAAADLRAIASPVVAALAGAHIDVMLLDAGAGADLEGAVTAGIPPSRDLRAEAALSVGDVAAAVDAGRELAAHVAAAGAELVAGVACAPAAAIPATCLAAILCGGDIAGDEACRAALQRHPDAARGPLHALRRVGGGDLAALCGLALGAGEHGLGFVADGLPALAAAAVAAAIEPDLRPRLLAAASPTAPAEAALLAQLGLEPVVSTAALGPGAGAVAALALARLAAAAARAA